MADSQLSIHLNRRLKNVIEQEAGIQDVPQSEMCRRILEAVLLNSRLRPFFREYLTTWIFSESDFNEILYTKLQVDALAGEEREEDAETQEVAPSDGSV